MKKITKIVSLVLLVVMAVSMVACSSYGALKKAFENEGYTESKEIESLTEAYKKDAEKSDIAVTMHAMVKDASTALIFEFKSTDDLKKLYDESSTIQGIVKDVASNEDAKEFVKALEEAGYAKGNCLVIPIAILSAKTIRDIVKNA